MLLPRPRDPCAVGAAAAPDARRCRSHVPGRAGAAVPSFPLRCLRGCLAFPFRLRRRSPRRREAFAVSPGLGKTHVRSAWRTLRPASAVPQRRTAAGAGVHVLRLSAAALPQPPWSQAPRPGRRSRSPEALRLVRETRRQGLPRGPLAGSCAWLLALGPWPTEGGGGRPESGPLALSTHAPGPSRPLPSTLLRPDVRRPRSPARRLCPGLAPCRWANLASGTHL